MKSFEMDLYRDGTLHFENNLGQGFPKRSTLDTIFPQHPGQIVFDLIIIGCTHDYPADCLQFGSVKAIHWSSKVVDAHKSYAMSKIKITQGLCWVGGQEPCHTFKGTPGSGEEVR